MVRLFFGHILYNLLAKAWYGNFLLLSINWPILIIWLSNVPLYACFFRRVLNIKILSFPHMARELSVQIEWRRILAKCNCSFKVPTWLVPDKKCATKIVKIGTIRDYSDQQNIIFPVNQWIELQKPFFRHDSNLQSCRKRCFRFNLRGSWQRNRSNAALLKLQPKSSKMVSKNWIATILATLLLM